MVAALVASAALAAGIAASGCGGSSDSGGGSGGGGETTAAQTQPPQVAVQAGYSGFNATRVFQEASPGVVTIRSVFGVDGDSLAGASAAEGSGFVLSDNGLVVTNAHVVTDGNGSDRTVADQVFVEFNDRDVIDANVVGFDPFYDVALLKVDPDDAGGDLHELSLGNDRDLEVGEPVAAIGSPFGELQSLSVGVVSATDRSVKSLTQFQIEGAIQTDASINPGNSGGPLLDADAKVIGINQQIETRSGANDGVGFAVPISAIRRSVEQLESSGTVEYAYIGVTSQSLYPQLAERLGIDSDHGGLIARVVKGGPAAQAGLRPATGQVTFQAGQFETGGDVILTVDGKEVRRPADLALLIAAHKPGETVDVGILRDGDEHKTIEVTLGSRPGAPSQG